MLSQADRKHRSVDFSLVAVQFGNIMNHLGVKEMAHLRRSNMYSKRPMSRRKKVIVAACTLAIASSMGLAVTASAADADQKYKASEKHRAATIHYNNLYAKYMNGTITDAEKKELDARDKARDLGFINKLDKDNSIVPDDPRKEIYRDSRARQWEENKAAGKDVGRDPELEVSKFDGLNEKERTAALDEQRKALYPTVDNKELLKGRWQDTNKTEEEKAAEQKQMEDAQENDAEGRGWLEEVE